MPHIKKYFGTDGIRGLVGTYPITPDFMLKLGWALGRVLIQAQKESQTHPKVLIGKDTRLSGYLFESVLEAGLVSAGVDVIQLGPMPTPGVAYLTRTLQAQAGIVISASHNPYYDNGVKLFNSEGHKLTDEVELLIEDYLEAPFKMVQSAQMGRAKRLTDAATRYTEFCKTLFPSKWNLRGLKCVVDCAQGAMYNIAPKVLSELGAQVITIYATPDGLNINQACGAVHPQNLQAAVLDQKADIGIAFDGDGDRLILVDEQGNVVDGDEILFILSRAYHREGRLTGGVIGTLMTNMGLEGALKALNIPFKRAKVGDKYVMDLLRAHHWNLGGEGSGHILCLDQTTTGDGLIAAINVLAEMVKTRQSLATLKLGMKKFIQTLINVKIPQTKLTDCIEHPTLQAAIKQKEEELSKTYQGRILLRASGTESLVRVMVEGEATYSAHLEQIAQELAEVVSLISQ